MDNWPREFQWYDGYTGKALPSGDTIGHGNYYDLIMMISNWGIFHPWAGLAVVVQNKVLINVGRLAGLGWSRGVVAVRSVVMHEVVHCCNLEYSYFGHFDVMDAFWAKTISFSYSFDSSHVNAIPIGSHSN